MKKTIAALVAGLLLSSAAQAAMVTYEFTGYVAQITQYGYVPFGISYPSSLMADGATYSVGDTFHGSFSYDTATPLTENTDPWSEPGEFRGEAIHHEATLAFDNHNPTYNSAPNGAGATMLVADNHKYLSDYFDLRNSNGNFTLGFDFANQTDFSAINGPFAPPSLSLDRFPFANLTLGYYKSGDAYAMEAVGLFTSLKEVSAVPEPSSYSMLLAGAALVGWALRRRGSAQA